MFFKNCISDIIFANEEIKKEDQEAFPSSIYLCPVINDWKHTSVWRES